MADVLRLKHRKIIMREASEWIARLESDAISGADREAFQDWLSASPRHQRAFEELRSTWREMRSTRQVAREISQSQSTLQSARPTRHRRTYAAIAACVCATLALVTWLLLEPRTETFKTDIGGHASVSMRDGTVMDLNTNTLASIRYTDESRVVHLQRGEAYFKVQPDATRPFWVVVGDSWVRAVGTAFNVYVQPTGLRVTVTEGSVQLGSGFGARLYRSLPKASDSAATIAAGEEASIRDRAATVQLLQEAAIAQIVAWRTGTVQFDREPLGRVIAEMSRYTPLRIVVSDPKIARRPVAGTFQTTVRGVDSLLLMLHDGLGLSVRRTEDAVYIEPGPSPR